MAAQQQAWWPPAGSPQYAGIRDAWRDIALAEALVCRPDGKRLFRVVVMLMHARFTSKSPPGSAGAAGRRRWIRF